MDKYHALSDEVMENLLSQLEELVDNTDMEGCEVEYFSGV